jgi:P pilus assembly chaperone PapD
MTNTSTCGARIGRNINMPHFLKFLLCLALLTPPFIFAAPVLGKLTLDVSAEKKQGSIRVKNTDPYPVLLYSSTEYVPDSEAENFLVPTQPVLRLEAGEEKDVRFVLLLKEPPQQELYARALFEAIPASKDNAVVVNIKQNIPAIVRIADAGSSQRRWEALEWRATSDKSMTVRNPSKSVIRMASIISLTPGGKTLDLKKSYILPGQSLSLPLPTANQEMPTQVKITPIADDGTAMPPHVFKVQN